MHEDITKALEAAKFRLLQQMARDKKLKHELEQKIAAAEAKVFERRQKLGEYNALFMTLEDAGSKAPRQRLGATQAVLGTRRIIERELTKLSNEVATNEMKLNKAKDRNLHLKGNVDALRKEHLTYRKLFTAMNDELEKLKERITTLRANIDDGYHARDRAQEEMRELAKQFELDKLERQREWALYTAAIEEANREGQPAGLEGGTGLLTQEEEDALRKKIRKGQMKMAKDRGILQMAQQKLAAFQEALSYIRSSTGYDDLADVVDLFNKYEEEKFEKLGAVNRMVMEIERLEHEVASTRDDVKGKDASDASLKAARAKARANLEAQAAHLEAATAETQASAARVMREVKALFPAVEVLFHVLGCDSALMSAVGDVQAQPLAADGEKPVLQLGNTGSSTSLASPVRGKPSASVRMYTSPALAAEVRERGGVTASNCAQYVGMVETRAADIVQTYAAMVATGALRDDGGAGHEDEEDEEAARAAAEEARWKMAADAAAAAAGGGSAGPAGDAAESPRRFLSPAALGPSRPTGKLKESLTTSALVAAMAATASAGPLGMTQPAEQAGATRRTGRAGGPGATSRTLGAAAEEEEEEEEDAGDGISSATGGTGGAAVRPLSLDELKRQAAAQLSQDRSVKAIATAATVAATVLSRGT